MKIAVVGSGISGLVCAHLLSDEHEIVLYESSDRIGGHTHTVTVQRQEGDLHVDTGFIVYNPENYPNFSRLLDRLGVETQPSNMSFSVHDEESGLEYNGTSLNTLFCRRRNLARPRFLRMVRDILRFYRESRSLLRERDYTQTLDEYLERNRYSREFIDWHIHPLGAAIWSMGRRGIGRIPVTFLVEFFANHGFLNLGSRPGWRVLRGGSHRYLEPLSRNFRDSVRLNCPVRTIHRTPEHVEVHLDRTGSERFDQVILATHSDQALGLLGDPSTAERQILGSIPYSASEVVLHTDERLLPRHPRARASWNYHLPMRADNRPSVTYWMNSLQSLPTPEPFCITLNRTESIAPDRVLGRFDYTHPVYTVESLRAQKHRSEINGKNRTWFCGAYWGYGFHEDGVRSALDICSAFGKELR